MTKSVQAIRSGVAARDTGRLPATGATENSLRDTLFVLQNELEDNCGTESLRSACSDLAQSCRAFYSDLDDLRTAMKQLEECTRRLDVAGWNKTADALIDQAVRRP